MKKKVVELFAGVGGFRKGLTNSSNDWEFVWANQWEPATKVQHAFECYINHFGKTPNHVNEDINSIDKSTIPNHTLLVGGFPCQDYSVARTGAKGIQGKKGVLWWSIYDTLKAKNPPFVLLENVDRLLKSPGSQKGRDFGIILACLNNLGYSVEWRVINAADYGCAQRRRRVFIFAFKDITSYARRLCKLSDWVYREGFFQAQFPICEENQQEIKNASTTINSEDLVHISDNFSFTFYNSGVMNNGEVYTVETTPIYEPSIQLKDILTRDVAEKYFLSDEEMKQWEYLKGPKRLPRTSRSGHSYIFSEGGISFPDPIDKPGRTMLTSEATKNRSTHVVADLDTGNLRLLTPVEAERLNGFPDDWTNTGMTERFRYFCMGNALVVPLVEKMGRELNNIFEKEKETFDLDNDSFNQLEDVMQITKDEVAASSGA